MVVELRLTRLSRALVMGEHALALRHSSAVISQISQGSLPETKFRSSVATMRMPVFSEMRLEARFCDGLWSAQVLEAEDIEPEVVDGDDGLGHQALAVPRQAEPEAAIVSCRSGAEEMTPMWCSGDCFQSKRPMPFVSALDCGESHIAIVGEGSVGGVWPGNDSVQKFDDLPVGKEALRLFRVGELERTQE